MQGWLFAAALFAVPAGVPAAAQTRAALPVPHQPWSFKGPFGSFDLASAQRGYAVYAQACASCHSMRAVAFSDLAGLGLDEEEIHRIAAAHSALPRDHFPSPYRDEAAARAANDGAVPPDLSRLARTIPGGASFIDAYLTGFRPTPGKAAVDPAMHYNLYVPGRQVAMPDPIHDGQVVYPGGRRATVAQMAHDVSTFLAWAAYPHLLERKRMGVRVMLYLVLLLVLAVILKRRIWNDVRL